MDHYKIFKRQDGTRYKIITSVYTHSFYRDFKYDHTVVFSPPRKKTWQGIGIDDYTFRKLTMSQRTDHLNAEYLKHVTAEEILETKLELWNKLKPV